MKISENVRRISQGEFYVVERSLCCCQSCILFRFRTTFYSRTDNLHAGARIIERVLLALDPRKNILFFSNLSIVLCKQPWMKSVFDLVGVLPYGFLQPECVRCC